MFRSVNIFVVSGLVVFVAWNVQSHGQQTAAKRANAVTTFQLNPQQAKAYDACIDALSQKRLKNGGSNDGFCGCFASSAANDDNGLKYSTDILKQVVADGAAGMSEAMRAHMMSGDRDYLMTVMKTARTARECVKDQQYTFASNAERVAWCAAKPERATDSRCQHLPL